MDRTWDIEAWQPTAPLVPLDLSWSPPEKLVLMQLRNLLIDQAKDVVRTPYLPSAWLRRGDTLMKLGYPELAAGDAYKAIKVCEYGLCYESARGTEVRMTIGILLMLQDSNTSYWGATVPAKVGQRKVASFLSNDRREAYRTLILALIQTLDLRQAKAICQKARTLYPFGLEFSIAFTKIESCIREKVQHFKETGCTAKEVDSMMRTGGIRFRKYPWIPPNLLERSPQLITAINEALSSYSNCIEMRKSPIRDSSSSASTGKEIQCYGYFATRDIRNGERIMQAPTTLGVCSQLTKSRCYNCSGLLESPIFKFPCCTIMRFCSLKCREIAQQSYHKTLCGKNFTNIYKDAETVPDEHHPALHALFWLRILACCVQEGNHPLEMPQIARLLAQYDMNENVCWSFQGNVVASIYVLEECGIDIFANTRYDSWVIEVMWHRIKNNSAGHLSNSSHNMFLNEHYSAFNHSCQLPPMIVSQVCSSTAFWTATRSIRKDEEVFTTYIGADNLLLPREIRQMKMMPWLGRSCACSRCKSEST